ncbi:MAG: hypothetical protein ACFFHV_11835, partial [Promethearchaeota archaeon]
MINVDIIIPSVIKTPRFRNYQLKAFPNWLENWFPVWINSKYLKNYNINIRFINYFNYKKKKLSNIVAIDSAIVRDIQAGYQGLESAIKQEMLPFVKSLREKVDFLIFFDNGDSTASNHFYLLSYVDRFLKKQLLKDFSLYSKKLIRKRLYSDFYANTYLFNNYDGLPSGYTLNKNELNKISLSWNFALRDYRSTNRFKKFLYSFTKNYKVHLHEPNINRKYKLSANYTIRNPDELIYFQRKKLLDVLIANFESNPRISIGKIPKKKYLWTQRQSHAVISPFGWGEICYRDFEAFIAGAALIKPNIDHLVTWPDLYKKDETYIPISWNIEDWGFEIKNALNDQEKLLEVAFNGQKAYKKLWTT